MYRNRRKVKSSTVKAKKLHLTVFLLIGDYGESNWYQFLVARGSEVKRLDI